MGKIKVDRMLAWLAERSDKDGIVGGFPRRELMKAFDLTHKCSQTLLGRLITVRCLKQIARGDATYLGRYFVTGEPYRPVIGAVDHTVRRPPEPEPAKVEDDLPFTSPDLKALGIEVVTRYRPQVAFCSPTGLPQLVAISLPRVRFLEGPRP